MQMDQEMQTEKRLDTHWRFQRTVSVDSILAILAAGVAVLFFGSGLDKRIDIISAGQVVTQVKVKEFEEKTEKRFDKMEVELKEAKQLIQQLLIDRARR